MKVKSLYQVVSPLVEVQIGDSKTMKPLTNKTSFGNGEISAYENEDIYAIIPRKDKDGIPYLAILIETKA